MSIREFRALPGFQDRAARFLGIRNRGLPDFRKGASFFPDSGSYLIFSIAPRDREIQEASRINEARRVFRGNRKRQLPDFQETRGVLPEFRNHPDPNDRAAWSGNSRCVRRPPEIQEARGVRFLGIRNRAARPGNPGSLKRLPLPDGPS